LALAAVTLLLFRPGASGPEQVSAQQAYAMYQNDATILDVRSQEEWDAAHIPGSVVIPLDELSARLSEVPVGREIVVVCTKGARSSEGARILVEAGIPDVACLQAGLIEWQAAGYPLEASPP
jgi:rhodanese-related sulfurtransferase